LFIVLSPENPDPMYRQVTDQIKDAIANGDLRPDALLPSIRELALSLDISVITVKRAYQDLETEGWIRTRRGVGSFVTPADPEHLRAERLNEMKGELSRLLVRGRKFQVTGHDLIRIIEQIERDDNDADS